jgi:hypothetical protein
MTGGLPPTRVRFADRQFLEAADLRDEQRYHREARWRHNLALHSWGVVAGLEVKVADAAAGRGAVTVGRGMALDGYGRELVVPYDLQGDDTVDPDAVYDVWLEFSERPVAGSRARTEELPRVRVTRRDARQNQDAASPDAVPAGDLGFGPDRPTPDPALSPWPVFLAGVRFRQAAGPNTRPWVVELTERRYAGLVAERIESRAAGDPGEGPRTVVLNGGEPNWSPYRFAVTVADPDKSPTPEGAPPFLAVRELPPPPPAEKDKAGGEKAGGVRSRIELRADRVAVAGDLTLRNGAALEFQTNLIGREEAHAAALAGGEFWRIYHHFAPPDEKSATGDYSDELRVTMPGSPAGGNRVSIGCLGADSKFVPVLSVKDDRSVEVYGNLVVNGNITGRVTDAPASQAGDAGGGVPPERMAEEIRRHLRGRTDPAPFDTILNAVAEDPAARDKITGYLVQHPSALDSARLAGAWWANDPAAVGAMGKATAGASAATFRERFLPELTTLGAGDARPPAVTVFGDWATTTDGRGADLARGFPEGGTKSLQEFAAEMVLPANGKRLEALVDALIDAAGGNGAAAIADRLVKKRAVQEVGKALDAEPNGVRGLLRGATFPTLRALAAELFDGNWLADAPAGGAAAAPPPRTNDGKRAIVEAWLEGLPPFGTAPTELNTRDARLRKFLKYVREGTAGEGATAQPFDRIWNAIALLVPKLGGDPTF